MVVRMPVRRRMDHGPMFICVNFGLFLGAIYILSHWATPTPIFDWLSLGAENLMGIVQLVGTAGIIFGQLAGTKYLFPGFDLRDCYSIVKWSCLPVGIAFGTFIIGTIMTGKIKPPWTETMLLFYMVEVGYFMVATELNFEGRRLQRELNRRIEVMMQ